MTNKVLLYNYQIEPVTNKYDYPVYIWNVYDQANHKINCYIWCTLPSTRKSVKVVSFKTQRDVKRYLSTHNITLPMEDIQHNTSRKKNTRRNN